MADSLLRLVEVSRRVGLKKTAIYAAIDRGDFPAPVKIGPSSRWIEAEVQAWIDRLKAVRDGDGDGDTRMVA